ncbi:MCE family protein [Rhodococcus sp. PAMC28707]|uniref:MCE family protein n=1 Tax=unclassified Rhodococcus (in: high G+C Gram-positive bacteria) TaxID=192944 RepID=UPI00109DA82A|nr:MULTISPECIES: MCE family protein [unclassified Rhodococcus (in: high G+C Gram-positive bacteria)]QCB52345.1 MCE family protein [Rhodococcus sp. PAMC28705]QCB59485.1 MCE family protein [Rhodococcus sp. PAMC28707]
MIDSPSRLRRLLLGLAFFLILILFVGWSITSYNKTFKKVVSIDLVTDSVGNALPANADVKVRGLIVGEVRSASTQDGVVTAHLAIDPDKAELIPSNTTARLLPKTLFGERYVSLIVPPGDTASSITNGTVLKQDTSGNAIEVGQLLDNLLPLLEAIPPQDLASTLGALAQGLSGRGEQLGFTIDRLDNIFKGLNTELPNIKQGLRGLADFSETYSDAAPQLIDALDNLSVTGNTLVEQRPAVDTLISSLTSTSSSTADFLQANSSNLIAIAADSREALGLLAEYSPSFGCTFAQFAPIVARAQEVIGVGDEYRGINVSASFVNPKGRYLPNQDEPRLFDDRGPRCYTPADTAAGEFFPQYPGGSANDGSYQVPSRNPGPQDVPELPSPQYSAVPRAATGDAAPASYEGSDFERDTLAVIYGQAGGVAPNEIPSWTTSLGAPALRGAEVTIK